MIMSAPATRSFFSGEESMQSLVRPHRAQVGIHAQDLADAQQSALGALGRRGVVELGQSDRAQERGVGGLRQARRFVRHRLAGFVNRDAAQQAFGELDACGRICR